MNLEAALLDADAKRRKAMIAGDVEALGKLLSDELIWTHSSGKTDTKRTFLLGMSSGVVVYSALDVSDVKVSAYGDIYLCHGTLQGRASRAGVEKNLSSRFLSVWKHQGGALEMLAWQSTGI